MNDTHPASQDSDLPAGLAQPALRALAGAGITRLAQLSQITEVELKQLHGLGPKGIDLLHTALQAHGLAFAQRDRAGGRSGRG